MQVPKKQCKRRRSSACGGSANSCVQKRPLRPNHVWSYDFVEDRTERGRKLRMLVVIDEFTRESLAIEVAWSFTAQRVVEVLHEVDPKNWAP
jgi:transposase InsO family protein